MNLRVDNLVKPGQPLLAVPARNRLNSVQLMEFTLKPLRYQRRSFKSRFLLCTFK